MKMDYRRDLQHNYLVVETGEKTENYITRMMTENQVQGLLGCECRRMDQKKLYYYDITSKISLAEKSRLKKVKGSEVLLIIQGLLQVLVQLEEYLIPADQICLDWNYIYLDPVSCYPSFCCLPAAEKKLEQGIRELLEELLPRLDHQEQTGVSVVYELYQYAIQDTFLVMGLQSVLERRLMEERKTTETELQACQEKKSREHQETSYFGDNRQQADLVLPSTAVSRVHASIEQRAGNWYLKDMNSRNGTWVNEQELYGEEEQELINGDQIRFADLIYQVKI